MTQLNILSNIKTRHNYRSGESMVLLAAYSFVRKGGIQFLEPVFISKRTAKSANFPPYCVNFSSNINGYYRQNCLVSDEKYRSLYQHVAYEDRFLTLCNYPPVRQPHYFSCYTGGCFVMRNQHNCPPLPVKRAKCFHYFFARF